MTTTKALVVEPYYTGSHRSWADGVMEHSAHDVRLVTHPGAFWKWRMHGAAVTLAGLCEATVAEWGRPDVVLVSDMVNVAALVGLTRSTLGATPVVLYMHENQLTYPLPEGAVADDTYAMANWVSMCAADVVAFNSEYHRSELFDALPRFLRRFPDHRHLSHVDDVARKSVVLPLGIDPSLFELDRSHGDGPPVILWNHRWEYDKDPAAFFAAIDELAAEGVPFRLAIAGEQFQTTPPEFARAAERLRPRIVQFGTVPAGQYRELLSRCDITVSTARHDFFGLAVAEAAAAGALPVLPRRLAYPELLSGEVGGRWLYADGDTPVAMLRAAVTDGCTRRRDAASCRRELERLSWKNIIGAYDDLLSAVAAGGKPAL